MTKSTNDQEADQKLKTSISSLLEAAREHPQIQAEVGWQVLMAAWKAGIKTFGDLLKKIEAE